MKTAFALVTGASSGMGLEFARQLAQRGYNLLIVSNEEKIHEVAQNLKSENLLANNRLSKARKEIINQFTADAIGCQLLSVYDSCLRHDI